MPLRPPKIHNPVVVDADSKTPVLVEPAGVVLKRLAAETTTVNPVENSTSLKKKISSNGTKAKYDKQKFSKALITHCRTYKFKIPDSEFLDFLDLQANGEVPEYDDSLFADEQLTQSQPSTEEEASQ